MFIGAFYSLTCMKFPMGIDLDIFGPFLRTIIYLRRVSQCAFWAVIFHHDASNIQITTSTRRESNPDESRWLPRGEFVIRPVLGSLSTLSKK